MLAMAVRIPGAILIALALIVSARPAAQDAPTPQPTFEVFLDGVRTEAAERGISAATLDRALTGLTREPVVVTRDRTQPEQVQSLDAYVAQRLTTRTTATARRMATLHAALLSKVEATYGVPRALMLSIWGLESNFGRFTGTYPTIRALATLAYDNRRPLFRTELFAALQMIERGVPQDLMKGSWAGAMGQPQFMPSSFLTDAVDFDEEGTIDIWSSTDDVFGSMANYMKNRGWAPTERWGREVTVPRAVLTAIDRQIPMRAEGCRAVRAMTEPRSLREWADLGVTLPGGRALPGADMQASLVHGQKRHFLAYRNYEVILAYNCSHSYAVAVGLLADRIATN